jgi:hypothetical protein
MSLEDKEVPQCSLSVQKILQRHVSIRIPLTHKGSDAATKTILSTWHRVADIEKYGTGCHRKIFPLACALEIRTCKHVVQFANIV